jgi:protein involved in polysaccharide export with SLBB domain
MRPFVSPSLPFPGRALRAAALTLLAFGVTATSAAAQRGPAAQATRAQLESLATSAEGVAKSAQYDATLRAARLADAEALRARLSAGDFRPGDRIVLTIDGYKELSDTLVVRDSQTVRLPNIGDLSLRGVLRSELQSYMEKELSRYINNPVVRASPLIRLALSGRIARPGFYSVPTDMLVTDVVMMAGGPHADADLGRTTARRDGDEIRSRKDLQRAVVEGLTIDDLALRSGDEIAVGTRKSANWARLSQGLTVASSLLITIIWLRSAR